jgi:hypothetical protein
MACICTERETIDARQALEFIQQENMNYFFDKFFLFDFFREKSIL